MSSEEEKILPENMEHKKKGGVIKAIYKLLTLGGLLIIVYKALQKQKAGQKKK